MQLIGVQIIAWFEGQEAASRARRSIDGVGGVCHVDQTRFPGASQMLSLRFREASATAALERILRECGASEIQVCPMVAHEREPQPLGGRYAPIPEAREIEHQTHL